MTLEGIAIGLLGLAVGLAFTFWGFRFFLILLPIWGFFAGFLFGAGGVTYLLGDGFLSTVLGWVVGFVIGLVFAVLSYLYYWVAVVLLGAAVGYAAGIGLMHWLNNGGGLLAFTVGVIGAIIVAAAVILLRVPKYLVIVRVHGGHGLAGAVRADQDGSAAGRHLRQPVDRQSGLVGRGGWGGAGGDRHLLPDAHDRGDRKRRSRLLSESRRVESEQRLLTDSVRRVPVLRLADLPEGTMQMVQVDGTGILVVNQDGLHAMQGICSHEYFELDQGFLTGDSITCALHLSRFDLATGEALDPPAEQPLAMYPVAVDEGWIVLELPGSDIPVNQ
jgi:nitrite reductase/ring-hydroxylating ferredoxin subunit